MFLRLIYAWYERRLEAEVRRGAIPQHVGVLPDGNRRFARQVGLKSIDDGHRTGADTIGRLIQWCDELRIPVVTFWVLSTDNFERPEEELRGIFALVEERIDELAEAQARSTFPRRIRSVGRRDLLPDETREAIERVEAATAHYASGELLIGVGYG
ncbi:MAG: undecaprenyl diphosphate synthase family protein, partial [Dehalococcoidia bacterium]